MKCNNRLCSTTSLSMHAHILKSVWKHFSKCFHININLAIVTPPRKCCKLLYKIIPGKVLDKKTFSFHSQNKLPL